MDLSKAYDRIGEYIRSHPAETYAQIAGKLGLSWGAVARIARLQGIKRRVDKRFALQAALTAIDAPDVRPEESPTL